MKQIISERRAGELLAEMPKAKPNPKGANQYTAGEVRLPGGTEPTLSDMGVS
jgi:hypothetical protein